MLLRLMHSFMDVLQVQSYYGNSFLRADPSIIIKNRRGQSGLWGYSISGDLPIVLLQIENPDNINLVRQTCSGTFILEIKRIACGS